MKDKFLNALYGLRECLKDPAIFVQFVLAVLAIIGGISIYLDHYEWLAFFICIALVICLEIVNSVIEQICDLYSTSYNPKIKKIKDMSAAAVLFACFIALIVCLICLFRRI